MPLAFAIVRHIYLAGDVGEVVCLAQRKVDVVVPWVEGHVARVLLLVVQAPVVDGRLIGAVAAEVGLENLHQHEV